MNRFKPYVQLWLMVSISLLSSSAQLWAQGPPPITLQQCQEQARANYPMVKQLDLIAKSLEYSLQNAAKGYLPQFQLMGQATYQSDVPNVPTGVPGVFKPMLDKDQYKVYAEMNQQVYDGGVIQRQKKVQEAGAVVDQSKIEVELFLLKDRVNQLFFGVLMIDEQLKQNAILQKDLQTALDKVKAMYKNGVALQNSVDVLEADLLKAKQKQTELQWGKESYMAMLAKFTGIHFDTQTQLIRPENAVAGNEVKRPELNVYRAQQELNKTQISLLQSRAMPKLNLFVQGGYAKPGFDFFKNDFVFYYIGGLRLNWNFGAYYTLGNDKKQINLQYNALQLQQETFLLNIQLAIEQQNRELNKYRELIGSDQNLVQLRKNISTRTMSLLENGVIQASDYLRELNAEDMARQNLAQHQIQLLWMEYNLKNSKGE